MKLHFHVCLQAFGWALYVNHLLMNVLYCCLVPDFQDDREMLVAVSEKPRSLKVLLIPCKPRYSACLLVDTEPWVDGWMRSPFFLRIITAFSTKSPISPGNHDCVTHNRASTMPLVFSYRIFWRHRHIKLKEGNIYTFPKLFHDTVNASTTALSGCILFFNV